MFKRTEPDLVRRISQLEARVNALEDYIVRCQKPKSKKRAGYDQEYAKIESLGIGGSETFEGEPEYLKRMAGAVRRRAHKAGITIRTLQGVNSLVIMRVT